MNFWKRRRPQLPESFFEPGSPVQQRLWRIVIVVCAIGALPGFRLWQVYSLCMAPLEISKETTLANGRDFESFRDVGRDVIVSASGPVTTWMTDEAALELIGGDAWRELPGEPPNCAEPWSSETNADRAAVVKARVEPLAQRWAKAQAPLGVDIHKGEPSWSESAASVRVARALSCRTMDSTASPERVAAAVRLGFQISALLAQSSDPSIATTGHRARALIAGTALRRACMDVSARDALSGSTPVTGPVDMTTYLRLSRLSLLPNLIATLEREASHAPPSANINTLLRHLNTTLDDAERLVRSAEHPRAAIDAVQALLAERKRGARDYAEHNGLLSTLWNPQDAVTQRSKYKADLLVANHLSFFPKLIESHARAAHLSTLVAQLATDADAVCALASAED